jgi:exonuclease III
MNRGNDSIEVDAFTFEETLPRTSNRQNKVPVTRKNDFFMVNKVQDTSYLNDQSQGGHNEDKLASEDDTITIYHQNIRGLRNKRAELLNSLLLELPQTLCITEHHLKELELDSTPLEHYKLGAKFCRKNVKDGGASIYVHESMSSININLQDFCSERVIEVCAIKIYVPTSIIYIISIYRPPDGNFPLFIRTLETILNNLYSANSLFIICGDLNINYLDHNCKKKKKKNSN